MHRIVLSLLLIIPCQSSKINDIAGSEGVCQKTVSEKRMKTEFYSVTCIRSRRTCWGPNWKLGIHCREKTYQTHCTKQRDVYRESYKKVDICCPGFIHINNTCVKGCEAGNYGKFCNLTCTCNQTENISGFCNMSTGACFCKAGWKPPNCTQSCPVGYYGDGCLNSCTCRNNGTCAPVDGACNCTTPGYIGENCDEACPNGWYGHNCSNICNCNENQTCDPSTGECICKAGLTGQSCTTVCSDNTYGADCKQKCECHPNGTKHCDPINGACSCISGKSGTFCNYYCPNETYGDGCTSKCNCSTENEYCHPVDGKCLRICLCNKAGTRNCDDRLRECSCTRKGLDVTEQAYQVNQCNPSDLTFEQRMYDEEHILNNCACRHRDDRLCVPVNGTCDCEPGYDGDWCSEDCPVGSFGEDCKQNCSCSQTSELRCNKTDGQCICLPGWTGDQCLEECVEGYYGPNCMFSCQCENNATCNTHNGTCTCVGSKWVGKYCDKESFKVDSLKDKKRDALIRGVVGGLVATIIVVIAIVVILYLRKRCVRPKPIIANNRMYSFVKKNDETPDCNESTPKKDAQTFQNTTFDKDDELYNVLNHNGRDSDLLDSQLHLNMYGHLNMNVDGDITDEAYDVMTQNQKIERKDDTYDHTENINDSYYSMTTQGKSDTPSEECGIGFPRDKNNESLKTDDIYDNTKRE